MAEKRNLPKVVLNQSDADFNLLFTEESDLTISTLGEGGGCGYLWGGVRASHGVTQGRYYFKVRLVGTVDPEPLPSVPSEPRSPWPGPLHAASIGVSQAGGKLSQLGTSANSWGYCSTGELLGSMEKVPFGQTARSRRARPYGPPFEVGDEIGCFVDSTSPTQVVVAFSKNGEWLGDATAIPRSQGPGSAFFPHIAARNMTLTASFQGGEANHFLCWQGARGRQGHCVMGPPAKALPQNCDVLAVTGLPGSGKTGWCRLYASKNPSKRFCIINAELILEMLQLPEGLPNKPGQQEKRTAIMKLVDEAFYKLLPQAAARPRNYILDYRGLSTLGGREHKLKAFTAAGFKKKAVAIVVRDPEMAAKRKRAAAQGATLPSEEDVWAVKASFVVPSVKEGFQEVLFPEEKPPGADVIAQRWRNEGTEYQGEKNAKRKQAEGHVTAGPDALKKPRGINPTTTEAGKKLANTAGTTVRAVPISGGRGRGGEVGGRGRGAVGQPAFQGRGRGRGSGPAVQAAPVPAPVPRVGPRPYTPVVAPDSRGRIAPMGARQVQPLHGQAPQQASIPAWQRGPDFGGGGMIPAAGGPGAGVHGQGFSRPEQGFEQPGQGFGGGGPRGGEPGFDGRRPEGFGQGFQNQSMGTAGQGLGRGAGGPGGGFGGMGQQLNPRQEQLGPPGFGHPNLDGGMGVGAARGQLESGSFPPAARGGGPPGFANVGQGLDGIPPGGGRGVGGGPGRGRGFPTGSQPLCAQPALGPPGFDTTAQAANAVAAPFEQRGAPGGRGGGPGRGGEAGRGSGVLPGRGGFPQHTQTPVQAAEPSFNQPWQGQSGNLTGFGPQGTSTQQLGSFPGAVQNSEEMRRQGPHPSALQQTPLDNRGSRGPGGRPVDNLGFEPQGYRGTGQEPPFGATPHPSIQNDGFGSQQHGSQGFRQPGVGNSGMEDGVHNPWEEPGTAPQRSTQSALGSQQPGGRGAGNLGFGDLQQAPGPLAPFGAANPQQFGGPAPLEAPLQAASGRGGGISPFNPTGRGDDNGPGGMQRPGGVGRGANPHAAAGRGTGGWGAPVGEGLGGSTGPYGQQAQVRGGGGFAGQRGMGNEAVAPSQRRVGEAFGAGQAGGAFARPETGSHPQFPSQTPQGDGRNQYHEPYASVKDLPAGSSSQQPYNPPFAANNAPQGGNLLRSRAPQGPGQLQGHARQQGYGQQGYSQQENSTPSNMGGAQRPQDSFQGEDPYAQGFSQQAQRAGDQPGFWGPTKDTQVGKQPWTEPRSAQNGAPNPTSQGGVQSRATNVPTSLPSSNPYPTNLNAQQMGTQGKAMPGQNPAQKQHHSANPQQEGYWNTAVPLNPPLPQEPPPDSGGRPQNAGPAYQGSVPGQKGRGPATNSSGAQNHLQPARQVQQAIPGAGDVGSKGGVQQPTAQKPVTKPASDPWNNPSAESWNYQGWGAQQTGASYGAALGQAQAVKQEAGGPTKSAAGTVVAPGITLVSARAQQPYPPGNKSVGGSSGQQNRGEAPGPSQAGWQGSAAMTNPGQLPSSQAGQGYNSTLQGYGFEASQTANYGGPSWKAGGGVPQAAAIGAKQQSMDSDERLYQTHNPTDGDGSQGYFSAQYQSQLYSPTFPQAPAGQPQQPEGYSGYNQTSQPQSGRADSYQHQGQYTGQTYPPHQNYAAQNPYPGSGW